MTKEQIEYFDSLTDEEIQELIEDREADAYLMSPDNYEQGVYENV